MSSREPAALEPEGCWFKSHIDLAVVIEEGKVANYVGVEQLEVKVLAEYIEWVCLHKK